MRTANSRAKILCIRPRLNPAMAPVLNTVVDEWVHALALHCEVEMIEQDFDLAEVCARAKPDLLLFDSIHWGRSHPLTIANADACPDLPRALLLNSDPHDPMRPLTFAMLARYGIDTVFCLGIEPLQQMPELRRFDCFVLPKFIDPDIFHDYGEARSIPLAVMSAHLFPAFYPWRAQVTAEIQHVMPALLYTHPGYDAGRKDPFEIRDESYARMLSHSRFAVADTTRLDYAVRKHLEIPAAGSLLVAPPSAALADYGFADMENCILGEAGPDLYARILDVAADPERYERIRASGHALVHARYTRQAWTYIPEWLACRQGLRPGEKVQQEGVFGAFRRVPDGAAAAPIAHFAVHDNPMGDVLRRAREALLRGGDLQAAAAELKAVMGWIGHIAEPWFLMGVIALAIGNPDNAAAWLARRSAAQGAQDPELGLLDPCEIAWLMLVAGLTGQQDLLQQMCDCAAATSHVSIRRMQWLIGGTQSGADPAAAGLDGPQPGDHLSIHWLGDEDFQSWLGLVQRVLAANGHAAAAEAA